MAARTVIAIAPLIHPSIFTEESTRDKLVAFVNDSSPNLQNYATGVLAIALSERELADNIVRTGMAAILLSRLRKLLDLVRTESDTEQGFLSSCFFFSLHFATDQLSLSLNVDSDITSGRKRAFPKPIQAGGPSKRTRLSVSKSASTKEDAEPKFEDIDRKEVVHITQW